MPLREEKRGRACIVTIHRPESRNAISAELARAMRGAIERAADDDEVRAVVLDAAGAAVFAAGGDLKEIAELADDESGAHAVLDIGMDLATIEASPLPVLAAVGGEALGGGCELLLLCDLVVMEQQAGMQFRHAAMGLAPAWGGSSRLIERVGSGSAADLLMTGRRVAAEEALAMGLAQRVVPQGQALPTALDLVELIARQPRGGVAAVKRSLVRARSSGRGDALEREREVFAWAWAGEARKDALAPFRRRPR